MTRVFIVEDIIVLGCVVMLATLAELFDDVPKALWFVVWLMWFAHVNLRGEPNEGNTDRINQS